jgi:hypothetical protein
MRPRFLLIVLVLASLANPSQAQLEPEAWTILKIALNSNPTNPGWAIDILRKYSEPIERQKLADAWLRSLAAKATGKVEDKRKQLANLLDAFDGSFAAGDKGKRQARNFVSLRYELFRPGIEENVIERATDFAERLRQLPDADRKLLKDFGKLAKQRINHVVK